MSRFGLAAVVFSIVSLTPRTQAQWKQPPSTGSPETHLSDRTKLAGQSGMGPLLTAKLLDKEANARNRRVVVTVQINGVKLVDAAAAQHEPRLDEAHVQYSLDDGPPQNTTSTTWVFDGLSPGEHRIRVNLAASDDQTVGEGTVLNSTEGSSSVIRQ